jgi:hypothetical protein
MMAVGATVLCAACLTSTTPVYGAVIDPDAGTPTVDAGAQIDAAPDAPTDAEE